MNLDRKIRNYPIKQGFSEFVWRESLIATGDQELYRRFYLPGLIIGVLLSECDQNYKNIFKSLKEFNVKDLMAYITYKSSLHQSMVSLDNYSTRDGFFESLLDILSIVGKTLRDGDVPIGKVTEKQFDSLLAVASNRIYLVNLWKKVRDIRYIVSECRGCMIFEPGDEFEEYGRVLMVHRREELYRQCIFQSGRDGAIDISKNGAFLKAMGPKLIPGDISCAGKAGKVQYVDPNQEFYLNLYALIIQIPFYFRSLFDTPFKGSPGLNFRKFIVLWSVLFEISRITCNKIKSIKSREYIDTYDLCRYEKSDIYSILQMCTKFEINTIRDFVGIISESKFNVHDLWLTPLVELENEYCLIPNACFNNFQWLFEEIQKKYIEGVKVQGKTVKKGKLFEMEVVDWFNSNISMNDILRDKCRAIYIGKQFKNTNNQELDVVVRIGSTYLIIEAKGFKFGVCTDDYAKRRDELIRNCDIQEKRQAFIDNYSWFKKNWDSDADFDLNPDKVLVCYLVSSSHLLGLDVNGAPVVDFHMLERYFLMNGFTVVDGVNDKDVGRPFYNDVTEAEGKLKGYLYRLPQLDLYRDNYKCEVSHDVSWRFRGNIVFVKEGRMSISDVDRERYALKLLEGVSGLEADQNILIT